MFLCAVILYVACYFRYVSTVIIIIIVIIIVCFCSLSLSEADRVCDEQRVSDLPEVVSSGRLPSASASHGIRRSLRGELLVGPALSVPQEVLPQWLRAHMPSPSQSI